MHGARHFSFHCILLRHLPLGASLTVEYPSESAPPLSGEDGGEFPAPSLAWEAFLVGGLGAPLWPVHTQCLPLDQFLQQKGPLPTNGGVESNLLEARLGTGLT